MHALIIEDEMLQALALDDHLSDLGYSSSDIAVCIHTAIKSAERRPPDLITADFNLLEGNGAEAVCAICATKAVPVVFITANPPEVVARIPNAVIIAKPYVSKALQIAIGEARDAPFQSGRPL